MLLNKTVVLSFVLLVNSAYPTFAQQLSMTQVAQIYLMQDCGTGEKNPAEWLQKVIGFGDEVIPLLLDAVEKGPSSQAQDQLRKSAKEDFSRIQKFIKDGGLQDLEDREVAKDAEQMDENTFVEMRLTSFVRGYQERALNALKELNNPSVINQLINISNGKDFPEDLKKRVKEAIEGLKSK